MPRSLAARLTVTLVVTAVAVLLAVGAALFVVLRDLHQRAQYATLHAAGSTILAQLAQRPSGTDVRTYLEVVRDDLASEGISAFVAGPLGGVTPIASGATPVQPLPAVPASGRGTWADAIVAFSDGHPWAASSVSTVPLGAATQRGVVFATPDRSGADTVGDLLRTIPLVAVVVGVVGGLLAWFLSRSTTGPLRRLAAATAIVPDAASPPPSVRPEGPTEVRELTERFNAMAAELARSRKAESDLLANLRHDLRTPLTVIGGFATALVDGTADGDAATRAARAIADETARLNAMVDELGALEGVRAGGRGLRPEPIDVATLLAEAAERFGPRAAAAGLALSANVEPATPGLMADRLAVERVVGNLIENALRALGPATLGGGPGSEAGPAGQIVLAGRAAILASGAHGVALSVSDDGPGFPPGSLPRVFERSYRADAARSGPGSGLGLAIVRELARAHGGDAVAENLAPHGARVSVLLPLVPTLAPAGAPAGAPDAAPAGG